MHPILESIIKCPNCSHEQQEVMPTDACIFFTHALTARFY
jgi:hypothetical protein